MEPLTMGAIAFFGAVAGKVVSKSEEKLATFVVNRAPQLLELFKRKRPELAQRLQEADNEQGEVLVAEVVDAANQDAEIKAELEKLGQLARADAGINQVVEKLGNQYINSTVYIEKQEFNF